ncbi:spore germination protein [Desulfitobacterium sp. PCE1]|uniref:spore germination protein n=1 Tax=Desulfitobacterium sp. PCE1 TaxID=146907 RepID=UPI00038017ED|nr:spore germination protein [Desulfitobacterium sp. PCE1]
MFQYIKKQLQVMKLTHLNTYKEQEKISEYSTSNLSQDLHKNLEDIKTIFGSSYDLTIREFDFGPQGNFKGALVFLTSMIDKTFLNESIMKPLMFDTRFIEKEERKTFNINSIKTTMLSVDEVYTAATINEIIERCLTGYIGLLISGLNEALLIGTDGGETRSLEEPKTETVVRGPRLGFTENLLTNISLLRRYIRNSDLTFDTTIIGRETKTAVCTAYIKGIANPQLIDEIKRRLDRIDTDAILESGYIEQFIEDAPFSIFSTVGNNERPDAVAAKILEGRAALLINGTPFVLTVPLLFIETFASTEDYYSRPYFAGIVRMTRFLSYFISILGPAIFVALSTFHQELIPTPLLFTMAASEEDVPFPAVIEALSMGAVFEILREAGIRLPRPVGQAVSIVGALVLGESAVQAGFVSQPMVIVISLTAVASFVVPAQTDSGAILRLIMVLLAGTMGIFGIMIGFIGIVVHLASLRSFGTPFFSPIAPLTPLDLKDTIIRFPLWTMVTRPRLIGWNDPQRQAFRLKPTPPSKDEKRQDDPDQ